MQRYENFLNLPNFFAEILCFLHFLIICVHFKYLQHFDFFLDGCFQLVIIHVTIVAEIVKGHTTQLTDENLPFLIIVHVKAIDGFFNHVATFCLMNAHSFVF